MMRPFTTVSSAAIPFLEADVDTDAIFPARFLLLLEKRELGKHLFHDRRYGRDGAPDPAFILNRAPFDRANVLVAGANFGCGSSREQAVWALDDFGIRCVIAPSFGEIFRQNCLSNGVLPVRLAAADHEAVAAAARAGSDVTVDLRARTIVAGAATIPFEVGAQERRALLAGLDQIGLILADDVDDLSRFEAAQRRAAPWIALTRERFASFAGEG